MQYQQFTPEMRKTHTILVPNMLPIHFRLLISIFGQFGYHMELLESSSRTVVEEGLKNVHNDTCYPALLVVGQFIEALKSGKYDPDKTALLITQTGGGCRASNYIHLLRKCMAQQFPQVPVISLNFAGHRRHRASELAEKETMPVIVRDLDDDAATIIMVDSNLQRESLLPSERAFAYKMKLDAMKHQGERVDLTCSQVGNKLEGKKSSEILAEQVGQSKNQIFRYIRLTELIPELLDMVDEKKIALNPAYELSFLKKEEQVDLLDAMDSEQATPSLSQAQRLKKYSQEGHLTLDMMRVIMGEEKKSDLDRVTFTSDTLRKYFPKSYTPQRMQETIIKLLEAWQKKRQRDQER